MQNVQDLQEKIFFEAKNILETLSKINTKEELLNKQDLFSEISERISFLKILEKNKDSFITIKEDKVIDNQELNETFSESQIHEDHPFEEDIIEEEVMFTNELNDIENDEIQELTSEVQEENELIEAQEEVVSEAETLIEEESNEVIAQTEESDIPFVIENEDPNFAEKIAEKERLFQEQEERRRKIVEFSNQKEEQKTEDIPVFENKAEEQIISEKKFKLANIKGLRNTVQSLFDEDPLEKLEEQRKPESKPETGSLLKTNIPTDFMEAEKTKPDFKLDLNDRVAFTKVLFKGDENKLKTTVEKLNSYNDIEEARKYLSDLYYQNEWDKVDEYAQRLWSLVENKFQ